MINDIPKLVEKITNEISDFCDIAVLGMSGGADSTLVTTLCMIALGKDNVYSLHMPYNTLDAETFNERSMKTAERLGVVAVSLGVYRIANAINSAGTIVMNKLGIDIEESELGTINSGNGRSRARMTVLYSVSSALKEHKFPDKRVRVIGTGNLSEDYIGYDTKGGDALADLFPIGELFKSEVYQLLEAFRDEGILDEDCIDRVPSAGLWDGQTDEDELGHTYNEMEPVIKDFLTADSDIWDQEGTAEKSDLHGFVRQRHLVNKHKHEAPSVISIREFCD